MKRPTIYLFVIAGILYLGSCKSKNETSGPENAPQTVVVTTEKVASSETKNEISVSGNIDGNTTVRLGFMVAGKINRILFKEGQTVGANALVASLDPTNYGIAKKLSDVQVNSTAEEFGRLKILHDAKSLNESDFSKITYALEQAKLQQQLQNKNLSDTKLYSPISGILLKKMAEVGEIVGVGTPLFVISDIKKVKVLAYIPESEIQFVKLGQIATVFVPAIEKNIEGKVIEVGSSADAASRTFTVKIEVNNPDLLLRPGMIAEAKIPTNHNVSKILLPTETICHDLNNQPYVFVADKASNKAFKRNISVGKLIQNKIEITQGINEGDLVITAGQNKLTDGSIISIK